MGQQRHDFVDPTGGRHARIGDQKDMTGAEITGEVGHGLPGAGTKHDFR